jgi:uncharacterized membrane protein
VSLAPLLNAAPAIQLHAFAALAAFGLGALQLAAPKGTLPHRTIGWIWVVLMVIVAATSFWIHELRVWGPWSPIHLLAIFTLAMLPLAVVHARRQRRSAPQCHDRHLCRRARDRRPVYADARARHACGGVRELKPRQIACKTRRSRALGAALAT